jgi:hypothetical protein
MGRRILAQGQMRSEFVVIVGVAGKDPAQMGLTEDDDVIEAFPADRADQSLRMPILPGRPRGGRVIAYTHRRKTLRDRLAEGRVTVSDHVVWLCLRKSRNRRPIVAFLAPCPYRRGHDHPSVRCRFPALGPGTQPRFAGARACCSATPGDRPASATPRPPSALLHRPIALGLALPDLAAGPQHRGGGQTGNRRPVAS